MAPNEKHPKRGLPRQLLTAERFLELFPDDDACLDYLMRTRYGLRHICAKCTKNATFHRVAGRRRYACSACGNHVSPASGTILGGSRTPLQTWFYAIFMVVASHDEATARDLERTLGVSSGTAQRMRSLLRETLAKPDPFALLR